ncbi:OsmC family protein [Georgenia sp. Z1344]|uniref:OsmC family protein n=1 Tax=Georgenia sp. Z1344 TaxID=3416706 RepID=UPI003CE8DBED
MTAEPRTPATSATPATPAADDPDLTVARTGVRTALGTNSRGASVRIGGDGAPDAFTPGELLQIALAACESLSADHRITHALGEDAQVVTRVRRDKDDAENRYTDLHVDLALDLASLEPLARERLLERMDKAIERHCTVGRTLRAGTRTTLTVTDSGAADGVDAADGAGGDSASGTGSTSAPSAGADSASGMAAGTDGAAR